MAPVRWIAAASVLLMTACGGGTPEGEPDGARGTRLTPQEVQALFIGPPWKGSAGVFTFSDDGTYVYRSTRTTTQWGPWRYKLNADGSLTGANATYTFYKIGPAYRYHNSETGEFYLAYPDTDE